MSTLAIGAGAIERLAASVLTRAGATPANAGPVARAIARAEAEQNPVCGLFYLPIFAGQLTVGKVNGRAEPKLAVAGAAIGPRESLSAGCSKLQPPGETTRRTIGRYPGASSRG